MEYSNNDVIRFQSHLKEEGGCQVWQGTKSDKGYGLFWLKGKMVRANRFAYLVAHGHLPTHRALHTCDNPSCCNPEHLYDGTHGQNVGDMISRRRFHHKLTDEAVRDIRDNHIPGDWDYGTNAYARKYGISATHVRDIVRRKFWGWLE